MLMGEEGIGELVRMRKVRWKRRGAGERSVRLRLEIRLRLCGDAGLVRRVQVVHVD